MAVLQHMFLRNVKNSCCGCKSSFVTLSTNAALQGLFQRDFVASSVLVTTSKALVTRSDALVTSSFLFLVVWPGAPRSVL